MDIADRLDQVDAIAHLPHRTLHFGVVTMADHDQLPALLTRTRNLDVDLGNQRTRCIEYAKTTRLRLSPHRLRHAVRAEDDRRSRRNFVQVFDEDRPLLAQILYDVPIVNDLMANIDRRTELAQRAFDDLDRAIYAGAKAAGSGKGNDHRVEES